nr:MAG TPA: hypothetical protein [Bacteriophage sp.]
MKGKLSLALSDGTVIRSKQLEVEMTSMSTTSNSSIIIIGISFLTDDAKFVNALLTEMHK